MADMKKVYDDLIIIKLYDQTSLSDLYHTHDLHMAYTWGQSQSEVAFKSLYLNDFTTYFPSFSSIKEYLENSHELVDDQKKIQIRLQKYFEAIVGLHARPDVIY